MNVVWKVLPPNEIHRFKADGLCIMEESSLFTGKTRRHSNAPPMHQWLQRLPITASTDKPQLREAHGMSMAGWSVDRVVAISLPNTTAQHLRSAMSMLSSWLRQPDFAHLAISLPSSGLNSSQVQALMLALSDTLDHYTTTLSHKKAPAVSKISLLVSEPEHIHRQAVQQATAIAKGVTFAKEWANRPPNHATPTHLGQAAKSLAGGNLKVQVLAKKQIEALGMGAFMAVTQGSAEPPQFITLEYKGKGAKGAPIVLIGKGITFDTGGISLKPAAEMDEMKFDMGGAASVLGAFKTLSQMQLPLYVIGLVPSCENMPSGQAVKPGDVVKAMNGTTIEVLNTDAEGRLILCDALSYSARFKPGVVIDVATLTGACVVALGGIRSGMYANDEALAKELFDAGEASGDLCWRMPLDEAYAEGLKSNFADLPNIAGGRSAGSVVAAKFLEKFVPQGSRWGHLDIAGTAWKSGPQKGSTGRPVLLLTHYLLQRAIA